MTISRRANLNESKSAWDALSEVAQLPESVVQKFEITEEVSGTVPSNYEPKYAYPLIVWLCDSDCPQIEALDLIASISPQNYLGLTLNDVRSPQIAQGIDQAVEFLERLVQLENQIVSAVRSFREMVNVHTERVFLAGFGRAATSALTILGHQPSWFAGCLSFSGSYPMASKFVGQRSLAGKRIFASSPTAHIDWKAEQDTQHAARMLIASGADVTTKYYSDWTSRFAESRADRIANQTLRDVDDWIISNLFQPQH